MSIIENSGVKIRENICQELRGYKLNDLLDQKRRQQLRENCHELRQLEGQLRSAVVFKQLREQQLNIAHRKEIEFSKKCEENEKFAIECEQFRKSMLQEDEQEKRKKCELLGMLKNQMRDLQQKRRIEFEDIKKDSDDMKLLLKQIQEEKTAQQQEVGLLRAKCKMEMEETIRIANLRHQLERDKNIEDTERNLAYQKQCDLLKLQIAAERKRVQEEKEALIDRVGQQLALLNQEKETREKLRLSLLIEECKAEDSERYRESLVKQINEREKARCDMKNYLYEKQIRENTQFKIEEEKFLEEHLKYLEERDKIMQLSDQKRRQKKIEHIRALKEMIVIRRYQKANEIAGRIAEFEKIINDERRSDELIKEERMRILNAVPKELLSYLPPGVLRPSDKEFLTLTGQNSELPL